MWSTVKQFLSAEDEKLKPNAKEKEKIRNDTRGMIVFGIVTMKRDSCVAINTGNDGEFKENRNVDLKNVICDVMPIAGDFVNLKVLQNGVPVKIELWQKKLHNGQIKWLSNNEQYGIVDKSYIFFMETSDLNGKLCVGDHVKCEIVKGQYDVDGKIFDWRCTSVALDGLDTPASTKSEQSDFFDFEGFMNKFEEKTTLLSSGKNHGNSLPPISKNSNLIEFFDCEDRFANLDRQESHLSAAEMDEIFRKTQTRIHVTDDLKIEFDDSPTKSKLIDIFVSNRSNKTDEITKIEIRSNVVRLKTFDLDVNKPQILSKGDEIRYQFEVLFIVGRKKAYSTVLFYFNSGLVIKRTIQIIYQGRKNIKERFSVRYTRNDYSVPDEFQEAINTQYKNYEILDRLDQLLPPTSELKISNYATYFHGLLYLDELENIKHFHRYDQSETYFSRENNFFALEMSHVFEQRPSIKIGDKVLAAKIRSPEAIYKGIIVNTCSDHLLIKFQDNFSNEFKHEAYSVKFFFTRTPYTRTHSAIDVAVERVGEEILFPRKLTITKRPQMDIYLKGDNLMQNNIDICWFNKNLNKYQREAVKEILRGECRPLPYIIYGPPGTGKTTVLVESILQLISHIRDSRLIVVAHSNSAANILAQRLIQLEVIGADEMLRLVGYNAKNTIPDDLQKYSATMESELHMYSEETATDVLKYNYDDIKKFRIVIGTNITVALLANSEQCSKYFTHAILDEAGQCIEPEALIPIVLVGKSGQIIMAGDPMQMPPMVLSHHAKQRGLGTSMMTRLLDQYMVMKNVRPIKMQLNSYDPRLVTKLLFNYRSLPSILAFFNKQFYDSELIATISSTNSREAKTLKHFQQSNILPGTGARGNDNGIYFVNVCGENKKIRSSTSWCNPIEAQEIVSFIPKLINIGLNQKDIGIISPYHLQVRVLKTFIEKFPDIKVGSIEEFQGQERKVILVSAVRTSRSIVMTDINRNMGFVQCPKRINVAISRARVLVVVYGKAELLMRDDHWGKLIEDCKGNGTFIERCSNYCKQSAQK